MSLMDILNAGLEAASATLKAKNEEVAQYKERYSHYDDERLKKACLQASGTKKLALLSLLKERGY